jgi:hypothetical protein
MSSKPPVGHSALESWDSLNDFIMKADEKTCRELLDIEQKNRSRTQFIKRIHSRLNKVRADAERENLGIGK